MTLVSHAKLPLTTLTLTLFTVCSVAVTVASFTGAKAQVTQASQTQAPKVSADKNDPDDREAKTPAKKKMSSRWQIGWGVDPFLEKKWPKPTPVSIKALNKFKRPEDLPGKGDTPEKYHAGRIQDVENVLWLVKGTVISVAAEHDGDYRLIIADAEGNKVCCVLPDPSLAPRKGKASPKIIIAREAVVKKFHPTFDAREVKVPVEIIGTGYFGRYNPEENPSPEGFQLHPIVSVKFPAK